VRTILTRVAKTGLPGDHHFYISFSTTAEGVSVSKRLKEKYRDEMTIVLQHRFWDLLVTDERFEVKLTFDGIPERLVVPFRAVKVFFDPSVRYGLQFEAPDFGPDATAHPAGSPGDEAGDGAERPAAPNLNEGRATSRPAIERKPRPARKPRQDKTSDAPNDATPAVHPQAPAGNVPQKPARPLAAVAKADSPPQQPAEPRADQPATTGSAQILSLDSFRKK
jgi:hypothetical protein